MVKERRKGHMHKIVKGMLQFLAMMVLLALSTLIVGGGIMEILTEFHR